MTQAFNLSQFANKVNTSGQADLATAVTGTLPVANGGTGAATLTANNVLLGNGTSAIQVVAPGSNGNILTSNGSTWVSSTPAGGGVTSLNGQTGAITNTGAGVIGSYVLAASTSSSGENGVNTTVAGSTLCVSNVTGGSTGLSSSGGSTFLSSGASTNLSFSGTWRQMSRSWSGTNLGTNLWVRIS